MIEYPVFVVEMPVDEDGNGPETDPSLVYLTLWQVWDQVNEVVATCPLRKDALLIAHRLNS